MVNEYKKAQPYNRTRVSSIVVNFEDCTGHQELGERTPTFVCDWLDWESGEEVKFVPQNQSRGLSLGVTRPLAMQRSEMEFGVTFVQVDTAKLRLHTFNSLGL
jgi:hypothetical protein